VWKFSLARRLQYVPKKRRTLSFQREHPATENYGEANEQGKKAQERQEAGGIAAVENGTLKRLF